MVERSNEAAFQAGGRKEEWRRESLWLFALEHMSPIMIFCNYFPKQVDLQEWQRFFQGTILFNILCHSQPPDLFCYYKNPVLISPQLFPGLWPSCPHVRKANLSQSSSPSYKSLTQMTELSRSRLYSSHSSFAPLSHQIRLIHLKLSVTQAFYFFPNSAMDQDLCRV